MWQGAAAEALTCDALAWQTSEGSGRIIEAEATVRVNNPRALLGHFIHIAPLLARADEILVVDKCKVQLSVFIRVEKLSLVTEIRKKIAVSREVWH